MILKRLKDFAILFNKAAEHGVFLFGAAIIAIVFVNSNLGTFYSAFFSTHISLSFGEQFFSMTIREWVNDFCMAFFFLLVGMEIKREMIEGHLSTAEQRILPIVAAAGGVIVPIMIYQILNYNNIIASRGWAIPAATDIAFTLGTLAIFGKHISRSLKVFVTALAIIDDLVAVVVVALFYTDNISQLYLFYALISIICLLLLNKMNIKRISPYVIIGLFLWYFIFQSGIHATVAGVILGMFIPIYVKDHSDRPLSKFAADSTVQEDLRSQSIGENLSTKSTMQSEVRFRNRSNIEFMAVIERAIQPFVSYIVLPMFAFANSNILFRDILSSGGVFNYITMGVAIGLLLGKQLGIFFTVILCIKCKIAKMPKSSTKIDLYSISILCGIGFTMSIFVSLLAFKEYPIYLQRAKLGVLLGSLLSIILGVIILLKSKRANKCLSN